MKWDPNPNLVDGAGCINDGYEAEYYRRYTKYLLDTELECCTFYFPYNIQGCIQEEDEEGVEDPCQDEFMVSHLDIYNEDMLIESEFAYYASAEDNRYCVNDGNAPGYMIRNPAMWKFPTLWEW